MANSRWSSTQMLRKMIKSDEKPGKPVQGAKPKAPKDRTGGFDPYDSG